MKKNFLILFIGLFFIQSNLNGQMNFVIGFNGGAILSGDNNVLLNRFNTANSQELVEPFKQLRFMPGLEMGLRYNYEFVATSVFYSNQRMRRSSEVRVGSDDVASNTINYSMGTVWVGLDFGLNNIRIGSCLGSRLTKVKSQIGTTSSFETIESQRNLVSKFYINIIARGSSTSSFVFRPYFDFAWGKTNLDNLKDSIGLQQGSYNDAFHVFGVSLLFQNGPQPNY